MDMRATDGSGSHAADGSGTMKVVEVSVSESSVDGIISGGVKAGRISLDRIGGTYARIH